MQVLKFGGTSVANASAMQQAASVVVAAAQKDQTIVVASALGGVTDLLLHCGNSAAAGTTDYKQTLQELQHRHIELVKALLPVTAQSSLLSFVMQRFNDVEELCNSIFALQEFSDKSKDRLLSFGELLSSRILSAYLCSKGLQNKWLDARELIITNSRFTQAAVDFEATQNKIEAFVKYADAQLYIIPGFIAADKEGCTTTLGRGGSDYSAAILGACTNAAVVEIWTDVSGMMTADPRLVQNAKHLKSLSYHEAMELSHFGAKVIYPPTIIPLMQKGIPVWIKNTFAPHEAGTEITAAHNNGSNLIRGISSIGNIALLSLEGSGMVGIPGFSKRLFEALAQAQINVILITQASSEHSICVGIQESHAATAKRIVDAAFAPEMEAGKVDPLQVEKGLAVIALVGDKMKSHVGVSGKMFGALGKNGVNIRAIAQGSSERNISAVILSKDVKKSVNVLHEVFFEATHKQLNLFIAGTGNVGSKLLAQLQQQAAYLKQHLNLQVRVIALANSRKMVFEEKGIDLQNWRTALEAAEDMQMDSFQKKTVEQNLRNSIFIDVTASDTVAALYENLLQKSIAVVACNKVACSRSYLHYQKLKSLAQEYNASFLFETNVGAGLPVIGTLNDLLRSGDQVHRIEAVLSGTLNYVFNHYEGKESFATIVKKAQDEGYTEPDPRLDLSGTDVMRKIMILAREAGAPLEMEAITNNSFMPDECMQGSVADFYNAMERNEAHFQALYQQAAASGNKLKYVASFNNGKATVGLQQIAPQHDFYHLYGKDNIILFYTTRYPEQPLVVKGAGAGAAVTASGVFADIMRAARV